MQCQQSQFVERFGLLFILRARVRRRREINGNRLELSFVYFVCHSLPLFMGLGTLGTFAGCRLQYVTTSFTKQLENVPNLPNFLISFANRQALSGWRTPHEPKCLAKNVRRSSSL